MKAILIDVQNETVTLVDVENIQDMYKHIGCRTFEVAHDFTDHMDSIYVDEEGLFTVEESSKFFTVKGGHQPFIGNGLVVGLNPNDGESVDVHITVEDLRSRVKFLTLSEVRQMV